ncbi:MAG: hypothetical protein EPN20_11915 [Magnetospirillum sp.]|nr:MAG: hypothetical protein EPN20_11915 [Magnetospirillum sp.]
MAINSRGLRGPEPVDDGQPRVLLLGSSITLGWGVAEENTLRARLETALGGRVHVLNAGIGNYNSVRYVTLFERQLMDLKPAVVVVQYFLRDAEDLPVEDGNALLEHSMLAALGYHALVNAVQGSPGVDALVSHYRAVYDPASPGRVAMEQALDRLDQLSRTAGFKVVLAMTPDIHQLEKYPFEAEHAQMQALAKRHGWTYVDFLPGLKTVASKDLYAIPGDPHPNATGHRIMAEALTPTIQHLLHAVP